MRRVAVVAMVVVVGFGLAGCSRDGDAGADTTVPTAPRTTSTAASTVLPDIATIPAVIDAPYLNRVFIALEHVETEATRVIAEAKGVPQPAAEILNAIYSDDWFQVVVSNWAKQLADDPQLQGLKRPFGDRRTTVRRLISASPTCVWTEVERDYSQTDTNPGPVSSEYVELRPLDRSNDPNHRNPTAWMIAADGFRRDGAEPANPCPAS